MSELRQDLISGDWVIIAPGREARPHFLDEKKSPRKPAPKSLCPFEDFRMSQNQPLAFFPQEKKWRIAVIPNKYPALIHAEKCAAPFHEGIYEKEEGVGEHILIIGRDHGKNFADLDLASATGIFQVMQERYRKALADPCVNYAVGFFNWGSAAGASVWHPHYQFLAIPAAPSHTAHSLRLADAYFKKHRRCVRCEIIAFEKRKKKRVIGENRHAIAMAPYASKHRFEISVTPKDHISAFEETPIAVLRATAGLLQSTLRSIKRELNDPDLNFFIHCAPIDGKKYPYHHWHIEIICRIPPPPAGFEFSTGIYINTIPPERAAAILRGEKGEYGA